MALKIEYTLVLIITLLIASILGINPVSKPAINSKGDKEVSFKNFDLFELNVDTKGKKVSAYEAIKYRNYLDLKEVNLSDENGHNIVAKRAIYENNNIFLKENILLTRDDGLRFKAQKLNYNFKTESVVISKAFILDFNGSNIKGDNLEYNMKERSISADHIVASLLVE